MLEFILSVIIMNIAIKLLNAFVRQINFLPLYLENMWIWIWKKPQNPEMLTNELYQSTINCYYNN